MVDPSERLVAIPDTDGELDTSLALLEEILLQAHPDLVNGEEPIDDFGPDEVEAIQRLSLRLFVAEGDNITQLYSPTGFEHPPVAFALVLVENLAAVGRAIARLGRALHGGSDDDDYLVDVMTHMHRGRHTPADLVATFAEAHGVLDLAPDDDTRLLAEVLDDPGPAVTFTADQDQAYRRWSERVLAMKGNDPLERLLFRGP